MTKRLLVFLRAYNDLDHIVPIIYKWHMSTDVPVEVVITGPRELLHDYRIEFIRQYDRINVNHLDDVVSGVTREWNRAAKLKDRTKICLRQFVPLFALTAYRRRHESTKSRTGLRRLAIADQVLDELMPGVEQGVIAFDWTYTELARATVENARRRGWITVSLPHGDRSYSNRMFTDHAIDYTPLLKDKELYNTYDYVIMPNPHMAAWDSYHVKDKLRILGSPRFNDEWLGILDSLARDYHLPVPAHTLKVVVFLRDSGYPIHYQELATSMTMLLQFRRVHLVIKGHTRKAYRGELDTLADLRRHERVTFAGDDVHSGALIRWADVVLDLGTSICFEAVKRGIPVLSMEYVHANVSMLAELLPEGAMRCRDDLYDTFVRFLDQGTDGYYDAESRNTAIAQLIDYPDENVLERYVDFLRAALEESGGRGRTGQILKQEEA